MTIINRAKIAVVIFWHLIENSKIMTLKIHCARFILHPFLHHFKLNISVQLNSQHAVFMPGMYKFNSLTDSPPS
jgi:hypothetical protein